VGVVWAAAFVIVLAGCGGGDGAKAPSQAADDSVVINVDFPTEEMDLPNGLHVVLHHEPAAPSALVHVHYSVGSKDDPRGRSGSAHLYEHLMFKGSKNTGKKDYMDWISDLGGESNAFTREESTDYFEYVPPAALARAIWLEADRMAYPLAAVDEDAFTRERNVVKNEWRQHYDDVPLANLDAIAREAVFGLDHPYGTEAIGTAQDLDQATLAEARIFAARYYRPNNATLLVCGPFDPASTKELVTRYFASIPPAPIPPSRTLPPPSLAAPKRIAVEANVEGPAVMLAWPAPATHGDGSDEIGYGMGFFSLRVNRRLVIEKKIANSVNWHYDHGRLGGLVTVTVKLKPHVNPDDAIGILDEYLSEATRVGRQRRYPWENFKDFKTRALVNEVAGLESLEGRAMRIIHDLELHGQPNAMKVDLRRLLGVSVADVGAAMEHFFVEAPRVTMVVTPTPAAPRSGRKAGQP
jgi:zinc protease